MSIGWSALYAVAFLRLGRTVAAAMGIAVFSHFALDTIMHPPDLALWPGGVTHLGLGPRKSRPTGWWFVELIFIAGCLLYYVRQSMYHRTFGGKRGGVVATVLVLHVLNAPWRSSLY